MRLMTWRTVVSTSSLRSAVGCGPARLGHLSRYVVGALGLLRLDRVNEADGRASSVRESLIIHRRADDRGGCPRRVPATRWRTPVSPLNRFASSSSAKWERPGWEPLGSGRTQHRAGRPGFPGDDAQREEANSDENRTLHRITVPAEPNGRVLFAALLRHELEHVRQWDAQVGVFELQDFLEYHILPEIAGGSTAAEAAYQQDPQRDHRNAAASVYIASRFSDAEIQPIRDGPNNTSRARSSSPAAGDASATHDRIRLIHRDTVDCIAARRGCPAAMVLRTAHQRHRLIGHASRSPCSPIPVAQLTTTARQCSRRGWERQGCASALPRSARAFVLSLGPYRATPLATSDAPITAGGVIALPLSGRLWFGSVTSGWWGWVLGGGGLTLFATVDPWGLTGFRCVARRRPRTAGVT